MPHEYEVRWKKVLWHLCQGNLREDGKNLVTIVPLEFMRRWNNSSDTCATQIWVMMEKILVTLVPSEFERRLEKSCDTVATWIREEIEIILVTLVPREFERWWKKVLWHLCHMNSWEDWNNSCELWHLCHESWREEWKDACDTCVMGIWGWLKEFLWHLCHGNLRGRSEKVDCQEWDLILSRDVASL